MAQRAATNNMSHICLLSEEPEAQILGHNHRKRWNKGTNPLKLYNLSWVLSGSLAGVMEWDLVMNKLVPRSFSKSISVCKFPYGILPAQSYWHCHWGAE